MEQKYPGASHAYHLQQGLSFCSPRWQRKETKQSSPRQAQVGEMLLMMRHNQQQVRLWQQICLLTLTNSKR
jgi:hypothetical protein